MMGFEPTPYQVVTHPSTNETQCCLTSVISSTLPPPISHTLLLQFVDWAQELKHLITIDGGKGNPDFFFDSFSFQNARSFRQNFSGFLALTPTKTIRFC